MKDRERFVSDLTALAPGVDRPDLLWQSLVVAAPEDAGGDSTPERDRVRQMLVSASPPAGRVFDAWWRELTIMPIRALGVAALGTTGMVALQALSPTLTMSGHALVWVGLLAPWLGMLWSTVFSIGTGGPWTDWEAMAPVGPELRAGVTLTLLGVVTVAVSALIALMNPAIAGGAVSFLLAWAGPFALGAVAAVALAWFYGTPTALTASAVFWGGPLTLGATLSVRAWGAARWMFWYALKPSQTVSIGDIVCLAAACVVGVLLLRKKSAWTSS